MMFLYCWVCDFQVFQGKVCTLSRWGGKLNHLLMAHYLSNICIRNYWNRTTTVNIIVGGWVVYFLRHSIFNSQLSMMLHIRAKYPSVPLSLFLELTEFNWIELNWTGRKVCVSTVSFALKFCSKHEHENRQSNGAVAMNDSLHKVTIKLWKSLIKCTT